MLRPILLVEDNEQDELLTLRALRKNNVANDVHVARDGAEALAYLGLAVGGADLSETPPALPQIVLLDLKLPKIDGLEVLKEIRTNPRTQVLPVVILTTSKEERDIAKGYALGANSYVRKPVDFDTFIEAIRQLGLYWLILNEGPADTIQNLEPAAPSRPARFNPEAEP
ncbi:MAG: response regulator [Bdellovibrionaceae bacterium]|nr:response regulator [Pseudobdellovibrionaceae bacterium]